MLIRGRLHVPCRPARPAVPRLAAGAAALKDASRRASARWPRKNEAILDRGGARCLGMFRPGRENGTPAEPENVDCGAGWRTLQRPRTARIFTSSCRVAFTACGDLGNGGRILGVFSFRVSGVGFGPSALRVIRALNPLKSVLFFRYAAHRGDQVGDRIHPLERQWRRAISPFRLKMASDRPSWEGVGEQLPQQRELEVEI